MSKKLLAFLVLLVLLALLAAAIVYKAYQSSSYSDQVDLSLICAELDHFISLELGGAPSSENNLWVEPYHTQRWVVRYVPLWLIRTPFSFPLYDLYCLGLSRGSFPLSPQEGKDTRARQNTSKSSLHIVNGKEVGARQKDGVESALKRKICSKTMTLFEAQYLITSDWYAFYLNSQGKLGSMTDVGQAPIFDSSDDALDQRTRPLKIWRNRILVE